MRRVQGALIRNLYSLFGAQLKSILLGAMPAAKKDNDRNRYSDIRVEEFEGIYAC